MLKLLSGIICLFFVSSPVFSSIGFFGSEIEQDTINSGDSININYNIVNREDKVRADLMIIYEIRNIEDMSLLHKESKTMSFAPYEFKKMNDTIKLPYLPQGNYIFSINLKSSSGTPISFISHEIFINGDSRTVKFEKLPYLKIYFETGTDKTSYETSYSLTGRPVLPDTNFDVVFALENLADYTNTYQIKYTLRQSHSDDEPEVIGSEFVSLYPNEIKNHVYEMSYSKSGTYDLIVEVYDGQNIIANKEVRLVIVGNGGNILDVRNQKDTYLKNEYVNINVSFVGPADGFNIVQSAYIKADIILPYENIIATKTNQISKLDFIPQNSVFYIGAPQDLNSYKLRLTLGKDEEIYDVVEIDYEPLNPDLVISEQGFVYDPDKKGCLDDTICTEVEKEIGNCYDCIAPKYNKKEEVVNVDKPINNIVETKPQPSPNRDSFYWAVTIIYNLTILLLFIVSLYIIVRKKDDKKKK